MNLNRPHCQYVMIATSRRSHRPPTYEVEIGEIGFIYSLDNCGILSNTSMYVDADTIVRLTECCHPWSPYHEHL
jgi:hypothetical protein